MGRKKIDPELKRKRARERARAYRARKKAERAKRDPERLETFEPEEHDAEPPEPEEHDAEPPEPEPEDDGEPEREAARKNVPHNASTSTVVATQFCNALLLCNEELRKRGATPWVPDGVIKTVLYEAAKQVADKYNETLASALQPEFVCAIGLVPVAQLFLGGRRKPYVAPQARDVPPPAKTSAPEPPPPPPAEEKAEPDVAPEAPAPLRMVGGPLYY